MWQEYRLWDECTNSQGLKDQIHVFQHNFQKTFSYFRLYKKLYFIKCQDKMESIKIEFKRNLVEQKLGNQKQFLETILALLESIHA